MFVLFDSRARHCAHGKRLAYQFPETAAGLCDAWALVLCDEVPDEYHDYIGLVSFTDDAHEVFNDYWACYGWYLNRYVHDHNIADYADVEMR